MNQNPSSPVGPAAAPGHSAAQLQSVDKGMHATRRVRVWDLPTRLVHWSLVILVTTNVYTGFTGGLWEMDLHMLSGYGVLALLLFRFVWGVVGSFHSRFASFVRGPRAIVAYARSLLSGGYHAALGHNPMGAWSVMAMLASLLVQAVTGLFSQDDILTKGPLVPFVSDAFSKTMTGIHEINSTVLLILIGLHLTAIAVYTFGKGEKLVPAMLTGRKALPADEPLKDISAVDRPFVSPWRALILFAVAAGVVYRVVTL